MTSLKGQLLIASPRLLDPNFFHTVVLMVQHDKNGALGLILNRPVETTIQEVWQQVSEGDLCEAEGNLHQGGPCEGPLMVVHSDPACSDMEIIDGVYFCARKDEVEQLVAKNSSDMKFFVGYAGWAPGQLENEMKEGSWLTADASFEAVFKSDASLWDELARRLSLMKMWPGLDPGRIPDDPSVN